MDSVISKTLINNCAKIWATFINLMIIVCNTALPLLRLILECVSAIILVVNVDIRQQPIQQSVKNVHKIINIYQRESVLVFVLPIIFNLTMKLRNIVINNALLTWYPLSRLTMPHLIYLRFAFKINQILDYRMPLV